MKRYEVEQVAGTKKAVEKAITDRAKDGWEIVELVPGMSASVIIVFVASDN